MPFITLLKASEINTDVKKTDYNDGYNDSSLNPVLRILNTEDFVDIKVHTYKEFGFFEVFVINKLEKNELQKFRVWGDPITFGKLLNKGGVL